MFTGIVTDIGEIRAVESHEDLRRLTIACSYHPDTIQIGASIACAGVCMTVTARGADDKGCWFAVDAGAETLAVTTVSRWSEGRKINLERSLKVGDELGGHIVMGHIDGIADIVKREDLVDMARLAIRAPASLSRFIAPKGSIALDGVSLTVNAVEGDTFSVFIIPHTLKVSTLGGVRKNDILNVEIDVMARYAARLLDRK
jgi:riboflavin synthase